MVTVSTEGRSPAMAKYVKNWLALEIPDAYGQWLDRMGALRSVLQEGLADAEQREKFWRLVLNIRLWNWLFREIWTRQRSVYAVVLAVLGLNHKTVSVDIREKFSISEESAREGLLHLSEQEGIKEAVVLSTCNRTEIYAVLKDEEDKEKLYHFS